VIRDICRREEGGGRSGEGGEWNAGGINSMARQKCKANKDQ
jgi:hypothetical protein